ncbi:HAD family hydrolase [Natronomonas amylolytica]|uniref:HAD family hydrolase n=1 Tax=Natronomonas amylolytica TaxID=3108498 RepID=UPI00300A403A
MQLDAVLFDIDDTLCRYRRSGAEILDAAFERTGHDPFITLSEYHGRYPEFVDDSDSMTDLRERCFAAIAESKGRDPETGRAVAQAFAAERDHANVEPLPGVDEALSAVDGLPVGVVTNGAPEMQTQKLAGIGLEDAFDTVVYAGYDAPAKPNPEPFETALSELSASPDRTLHVGNSLQSDVAGARAAGLRSVWVPDSDEPAEPEPDYTLSTLSEFPTLLSDDPVPDL